MSEKLEQIRELLAKATATPWQPDPEGYAEYIWGPNFEMIATMRGHAEKLPKDANQALIVAAVNFVAELANRQIKSLVLEFYEAFKVAQGKEADLAMIEDFMRRAMALAHSAAGTSKQEDFSIPAKEDL